MSTFYYWLPSERPYTSSVKLLEELRVRGLAYALEDRITPRTSDVGPDGKKGVLVCHGGNEDGQLGWWSDKQTWKQMPGSDVWCGMYSDRHPTAEVLARTEQITGEWLTLEDGGRWLAPKARRFIHDDDQLGYAINLPQRLTLSSEGTWRPGDVKPRYERLWKLACEYGDAWAKAISRADEDDGQVAFELDDQQLLDTAVAALQTNYRIGPVELDLLGIFDQQTCWRILGVLIDEGTYAAWVKKKANEPAAAGGNS